MEVLLILLALGYGLLPLILLFWVIQLGRRLSRVEAVAGLVTADVVAPLIPTGADPDGKAPPETDPVAEPDQAVATHVIPMPDPWSGAAPVAVVPVPGPVPGPVRGPVPVDAGQDQPIVFRRDRFAALGNWLKVNWVYAVSAASLALAGIFLVQYGVEKGLIPPALRVGFALAFGGALVLAGEWLRRQGGDDQGAATAFLPQVFAGAGIVTLFAAVIAARQLYGLVGAEVAMGGLVLVAGLAVLLGWFHGPLLAAVGLTGAALAPFVVVGTSSTPAWLYGYFTLIGAAGLAIDAARRWAWISVLALVLAFGCNGLTLLGYGGAGWHDIAALALALLALGVPVWRLVPDHDGPMISETLVTRGQSGWPAFPVRIAGGAVLAASILIALAPTTAPDADWLRYLCLTALALALMLWARRARGLCDLAVLPVLGWGFSLLAAGDYGRGALISRFRLPLEPGDGMDWTATLLLAMAVAMTLAAAWRALNDADWRRAWGLGACLIAPVAAAGLELVWAPAVVVGPYLWALQIIALAALMVALAARFARMDGTDHARTASATLSALSLIALALFVLTTGSALTLALAVLVVVALALDWRFELPQMGLFVQVAIAALGWRLVVDPGLGWAVDAPVGAVVLTFGGVLLGLVAGLWLIRERDRIGAQAFLESAFAGFAAIFANLLIERWVTVPPGMFGSFMFWNLSLQAMPWLVAALVQLYRLKLGGWLRWVRIGLAGVTGLVAMAALAAAVGPFNPLFDATVAVQGWLPFDTLLLAYGLPGLGLLVALRWLGHLPRRLRIAMVTVGSALVAVWVALAIRHVWQGPVVALPGITQPELYSYTVALLLTGGALLYQAIARRSVTLRRLAMAVIGVTVAKVFLIDAAGLSGLTRVFSFLALGLSLAGLAWLNRWAAGQGKSG